MLVTYTGKTFDYNNITKDSIDIEDILHSIVRINRFIGHSSRAYSVGEHTYVGLLIADKMGYTPLQKLHWLIHDFTEAYVGDCPTPLKRMLPKFEEIEYNISCAIMEHLGLEPITEEEHRMVKRIDTTMLVIEMRDLTLHDFRKYVNDEVHFDILMDDYFVLTEEVENSEEIKEELRKEFDKLMKEVKGIE